MERLTTRNEGDRAYYYPNCFKECDGVGYSSKCDKCGFQDEVCEKLGEYDDLDEQGLLLKLPCKVGDIIYRICPKCNDKHDGSCKNCAWSVGLSNCGCDIYGLWSDGQYPPKECTIVPYKVYWNYIPNLMEHLGKTVFLTQAEAEEALKGIGKKNKADLLD